MISGAWCASKTAIFTRVNAANTGTSAISGPPEGRESSLSVNNVIDFAEITTGERGQASVVFLCAERGIGNPGNLSVSALAAIDDEAGLRELGDVSLCIAGLEARFVRCCLSTAGPDLAAGIDHDEIPARRWLIGVVEVCSHSN